MSGEIFTIQPLLKSVENYAKTTLELEKLKMTDKISGIIAIIILKVFLFIAVVTIALFVNLGLALWIGTLLGETFYGFFVVGGIYAVLIPIVYLIFKQSVKQAITDTFITQILNIKHDEN